MEKTWNILGFDAEKTAALKQSLGISYTICKMLVQRGLEDYNSSKDFFRPSLSMLHDPFLMKDMDKAVPRIITAFHQREKILVFGDYDVDGTTAVATVYNFLSSVYEPSLIDFYVPHRYREGYGVSKAGIDFAASNGFSLIVCLDCGVRAVELIAYAAEMGIGFIVCDHHLPGDVLPAAVAILNTKQEGCNYPYKELCGCGVGFKLISGLIHAMDLPMELAYEYLDLVATAIAADIVPITGENRILAYFGLRKINEAPLPGIRALISLSGTPVPLTITSVVFMIAPRVNAAGRMDDARKAVQLFIEKDAIKAMELAEMLHSDNTDRREADKQITLEALEIIMQEVEPVMRKTTVVYKEDWHKGVVGIVASRLIEKHYRPTVVLTRSNDIATGSARSITGFNLYEAIYACRDYLITFGGHFAAAGLSMLPENVEPFRKKFEEIVAGSIDEKLLTPEIIIDAELSFSEINDNFFQIIAQMEPFGPGNMRPVFITRKVTDTGWSKVVKEQHVRFVLQQNNLSFSGIGFNMAEKFSLLSDKQPVDIVYSIDENEWNGNKNLQLKMIDIKAAS